MLLALIAICSCNKNSKSSSTKEEPRTLGKYIYISENNVVHTDKHCIKLLDLETDSSNDTGLKYVETIDFVDSLDYTYCAWCVEDEMYEHLQNISR